MNSSPYRGCALVALFSLVLAGMPRLTSAQNDPAAQFSPINNPNGAWKYGYDNFPLPSAFNLLTLPGPVSGIDAWRAPSFGEVGVYHNGNAVATTFVQPGENAIYQAGQIGMHPGPNDQYGVIQFTVPANGFYRIHGTFEGLDTGGGTNTLVDLLVNNIPIASGNVIGFGPPSDVPLSVGPILLNAGDTLAFAVGGSPVEGSTGLLPGAAVDAVPEPGAGVVLGVAIICLVGRFRRKLASATITEEYRGH